MGEAAPMPTACRKCKGPLGPAFMAMCEEVDGAYCGTCWDGGEMEACAAAHGEGCATHVYGDADPDDEHVDGDYGTADAANEAEQPFVVFTVSVYRNRTACHTDVRSEELPPIDAVDMAAAAIAAERARIMACPSHRRWLATQGSEP